MQWQNTSFARARCCFAAPFDTKLRDTFSTRQCNEVNLIIFTMQNRSSFAFGASDVMALVWIRHGLCNREPKSFDKCDAWDDEDDNINDNDT